MRLYVDSADLEALRSLLKTGAFYGVTTNPLILEKAGIRFHGLQEFADKAIGFGAKEVFFQSSGEEAELLYARGRKLAEIGEKIVVKLPATREGVEAAARLSGEGIKTCLTAVYAPVQALLADAAGAAYVAPYLGRMNDAGRDGHEAVAAMAAILEKGKSQTRILAASVRSLDDVVKLARNGAHCCTLAPSVARALLSDPLTERAAADFQKALNE
jgi:transaldolase